MPKHAATEQLDQNFVQKNRRSPERNGNNDSEIVRYSPDVEQEEPDFEQTLQQVLDDMKQHMRGSLQTEGIGLVVRNAHGSNAR